MSTIKKSKQEVIVLIDKIISNNFSDDEVDNLCNELYNSVDFGQNINDIIFFGDDDNLSATQIYDMAKLNFNE